MLVSKPAILSLKESWGARATTTVERETRATIEEVKKHFFSEKFLILGSLRPLPKRTICRKIKLLLPDETSNGLGTQRESCEKNGLFPTISG